MAWDKKRKKRRTKRITRLLPWLADKFKASWKAIRDLEKWEQYQRGWQTFAFLAGSRTGSLPSSRLPSSHSQREQDRVARGSNPGCRFFQVRKRDSGKVFNEIEVGTYHKIDEAQRLVAACIGWSNRIVFIIVVPACRFELFRVDMQAMSHHHASSAHPNIHGFVLVSPMEVQNGHLTTHRFSRREVYGTHLMLQVRCPE
jgi:hypothetical protein